MPANMNLDRPTKAATPTTPEQLERILGCLQGGYSITYAARSVGIDRSTIYRIMDRNPEFAAAVRERLEEGTDGYEDRMRDLAYSNGSAAFLATIATLKARRRHKWGDQPQVQAVSLPPINITIIAPSPAELRDIVVGEGHMLPDIAQLPAQDEAHDADSST